MLNGTTIEEVAEVHRETLKLALAEANDRMTEIEAQMYEKEMEKYRQREDHERRLRETAERIKFE